MGRTDRQADPPDEGQTRELFALLGDELCWRALDVLRAGGPAEQSDLVRALGVDKSTVSRVMARLREARLVVSEGRRDVTHRLVLAEPLLDAIIAVERLADEVNRRRTEGQRRAAQRTAAQKRLLDA